MHLEKLPLPAATSLTNLTMYKQVDFFDEAVAQNGEIRASYKQILSELQSVDASTIANLQKLKDSLFRTRDVTFTVYGDEAGTDRTFPIDLVPRIIEQAEWETVELGLGQRLKALNLFLADIYENDAQIAKDGIIPLEFITSCKGYNPKAVGLPQPKNARALVAGIDLVRDGKGNYLVLEDNLRVPSGVSYVLENRSAMANLMPNLIQSACIRPVEQYPTLLLRALQSLANHKAAAPTVVLLTPGVYNSAYFEHAFLAQNMGIELVEGRDLFVDDATVWMRTTRGKKKVDVVYSRIDDDFLDPLEFREDSMLGVPGIIEAIRQGNVSIANAIGNGVADNKAMYTFVPQMISYYLGQKPILDNVETYLLDDEEKRQHILADPSNYVIKTVDGSGGYDIFIGPRASQEEVTEICQAVRNKPANYIAQEVVKLSTHPTIVDGRVEPRHIDLRPFVVGGEFIDVLPGGLTRVALTKGSLIVNSSQGGGSKDTWVLQDPANKYLDCARPFNYKAVAREPTILARAAEPLFWAGRYIERIDATARLLASCDQGALSGLPNEAGLRWEELLEVLSLTEEYKQTGKDVTGYNVTRFLVDDTDNRGSILSSLSSARDNLRSVREKIPTELRGIVNDAWAEFAIADVPTILAEHPQQLFTKLMRSCQTFLGITESTMARNDTWRFLTLGRCIERALLTTRLVEVHFVRQIDAKDSLNISHWATLLGAAGALQEYRVLFQTSVDPLNAIDFLLRNNEFARSANWCVKQIGAQLADMTDGVEANESSLICARVSSTLDAPLVDLLGDQPAKTLRLLSEEVEHLSDAIHQNYFLR